MLLKNFTCFSALLTPIEFSSRGNMAPMLALLVGSLLAAQGLAEPFEKLFSVPEGEFCASCSGPYSDSL